MDGFGIRLNKAMGWRYMTRYKLAKECGISPSTLSNWLTDATSPDKTKVNQVADLLGVNSKWLLTGEGEIQKGIEFPSRSDNSIMERVNMLRKHFNLSRSELSKKMDYDINIMKSLTGLLPIENEHIEKIVQTFGVNKEWLITGEGEMLKQDDRPITTDTLQDTANRKQIPLYDDVASIGGQHEMTSDMIGTTNPSDYIDAGDWFREATVAIRHYGKSMTEYPPGCILALKEVNDRRLLIPGRDYVIETDEYRVTKKIQVMDTHIRAHSTNTEKYDDGTLIYQPFDVPLESIRRMFIVLGYVVKKSGGTLLYNK